MLGAMHDLAEIGIAKTGRNREQNYAFRGIDSVYNALAPVLVSNKLLITPSVKERTQSERTTKHGSIMYHVCLHVCYTFTSVDDGSQYEIVAYGEATDMQDKATSKALSMAYKYMVLQAFCVPLEGMDDADETTPPETVPKPEPQESTAEERLELWDLIRNCDEDAELRKYAERFVKLQMNDTKRKEFASELLTRRSMFVDATGVESVKKMSSYFSDKQWVTKKHLADCEKIVTDRLHGEGEIL